MTVNTIPAARLQFIKRLRHIEKMGILSLTHYDQNRIFGRVGPVVCGCIAGLAGGKHAAYHLAGIRVLGLTAKHPVAGSHHTYTPSLFYLTENWPHAYQTLYAHDRIEAAVQAILAVDEYGNFTQPSTEPAKLPDIEAQIRTQIDNLSNLNTQPKEMIDEPVRAR